MINNSPIRQQLIKSFTGVTGMFLVATPVTFLISIILARNLGADAFGQYTFTMSLLTIVALPVSAGLQQLLTREVAKYNQSEEWGLYLGAVKAAYAWVLIVTLLVFIVYLIAGPILSVLPTHDNWSFLGIVILLVPLNGLTAVRNGTIKGFGRPALAEMPAQFLLPTLFLMTVGVLVWTDLLTVRNALWGQVLVGAITFLCASVVFYRIKPKIFNSDKPEYHLRAWSGALFPFALIAVVGTFSSQIGIVALGIMGADGSVAAFKVGERAAQFIVLPLAFVNMVIAPHIVAMYQEGNLIKLQQLSRKSARAALLIAMPIGLVLIVLGRPLIDMTYGPEYTRSAYSPMVILVVGQIFNVSFGSVGFLLVMSGYEKMTLWGQLAGLAVTLVSASILIPKYQAEGAAISVVIGLVIWNVILGYLVLRHMKIRPGIF